MAYLKIEPMLAAIRSDPRFYGFLERMRLT
jgi:hypothetical protein